MALHTGVVPPAEREWPGWPSDSVGAESSLYAPVVEEQALDGWRVWSPAQEREIKWPVICRNYSVPDAAAVGEFMLDHPYLLDLLLEAYPRLRSLFGPSSAPRLERASDPDVPNRTYLLVTLVTPLPVRDALALMNRFADDWWLDHIAYAGRDLVFMVDFA